MTRMFQSSWFTALTGCLVYLGVTFAVLSPTHFEGVRAAPMAELEKSANDDPSWKFRNPEFDQWVNEVKHEREALDLRAQQLQELELRMEAERKELTIVTQTIFRMQADLDKNVIRIQDQELDNVKRQAKIFSSMSPESAAALAYQMPEDEAVRILFIMKTDETGAILEMLNKMGKPESQRAAHLTEKLRHTLPSEPKPRSNTF